MKKFIIFLCLGLMGCATVSKDGKVPANLVEKPTVVSEMELDSVISVFSEAIKNNPRYAGAYYNRAIAYFYKKNYDLCWKDVYAAESLGYKFSDDFINALKKASKK